MARKRSKSKAKRKGTKSSKRARKDAKEAKEAKEEKKEKEPEDREEDAEETSEGSGDSAIAASDIEDVGKNEETESSEEPTDDGWMKRVGTPNAKKKKKHKKKKWFSFLDISFNFGFKKKKTKSADDDEGDMKQKTGFAKFLASINNFGMGKQRSLFIQSMAMMLGAGLTLVDSLETLQLEVRSRAMKKRVKSIATAVENGIPLWQAMDSQCLFSPYEIALVHIGEEAGHLSRNMQYLAEQQEKDRSLRAKVKMAMIYPSIVLVLMFVIVMGLGLFVLPNLIQVLLALKADLPLTTRLLIKFTNVFSEHGKVFVPASVGGFILLIILSKYTPLRVVAQWVVFHIPGIGTLARQATIARFGVILGGMLQAGVPLVEALESLRDVTYISSYKNFYGKLVEHITVGDSFHKSFASIKRSKKCLPISVQQLITTGEQAGSLSDTLLKVADIYEKKASETAEKLPTILEPMLLLFIGALVGTIAFAIVVPIYSVVGNVGR